MIDRPVVYVVSLCLQPPSYELRLCFSHPVTSSEVEKRTSIPYGLKIKRDVRDLQHACVLSVYLFDLTQRRAIRTLP